MTLAGRVVLVTGATDGIGRETARLLAERGARVLVHGRAPQRVTAAVSRLRETGAAADGVVGDLGSLAGARAAAAEVRLLTGVLHVLVNNAGVFVKERVLSADGLELSFAVNHLAHFVLTHELLPLLAAGAPARILNVASVAHARGRLDLGNLRAEKRYDGYEAYAQSKLCNVLFTRELARRLPADKVVVHALHPGVIGTKLLREGFGAAGDPDVAAGAATSVHLATSDEAGRCTGEYWADGRRERPSALARDDALAARLWERSLELAGITAFATVA